MQIEILFFILIFELKAIVMRIESNSDAIRVHNTTNGEVIAQIQY